jgi:2-dehydropantoate 2-reductase
MRFVVFGAGAIGGVIGARLQQHGHSVMLIARGAHYEAIRDRGLRIESPSGVLQLQPAVVDHPSRIDWTGDDVVLLTTKTQDTAGALNTLALAAPVEVPVLCIQNGVENERLALRHFSRVYGVYVWCPTGYLTPGVVQAWCTPTTGILDAGCYPSGTDRLAETVVAAFRTASFGGEARQDIMRWKYRKLLSNLGNALEALCGPAARGKGLAGRAREEAVACFHAAGISFVGDEEAGAKRREQDVMPMPIDGVERPGGSTWQSLQRHAGSIETDYLNGEICLLGRLHGVPTPVNALLQRLSNEMLRQGTPPGSISPDQILAMM